MKNSIKICCSLFIMLFLLSCGKENDPSLELYVSAKESDIFQSISMKHADIRLFHQEGGGSIFQNYSGIDVSIDLTKETAPILVGEVSHWEGNYLGMNASLFSITVVSNIGDTLSASTPITAPQQIFGEAFELMPDKRYRVDFIYDVDASFKFQDPNNIFDTVAEVRIIEL